MTVISGIDMKSNNSNTTTDTPSQFTEEMPEVTSSPSRFSKNRKCVIISVASVVILVVVAIATLIGVKFYLDSKIEQMRYIQYDSVVEAESVQDARDKSQQFIYHVTDEKNDITMWVITDMRRSIQIMKTVSGQNKMCTVTPLDLVSTPYSNGQPTSTTSRNSPDSKNNTVTYALSVWPILDTSILGYNAEQLCQGIEVYWAYPSCQITNMKTNEERGTRRRRQTRQCYYYQCRPVNCRTVSYANDGRQYVSCDCSYQYFVYNC